MAIKIKGITVIDNSRKATLRMVNLGTYTDLELTTNTIRGVAVGDTVYNKDGQYTMSWLGSVWTNSVAGQRANVDTFSTTSSFPTPSNCNTIAAFSLGGNVVAGVRNSHVRVSNSETYTFMATLKFENPETESWSAWSSQSNEVFTNLVGKRDSSDFSDFFFPDGYAQKQLTTTGDDGDKYYTNDTSAGTHINWKSLVFGPPSAFNALDHLKQNSEFVNLRVSPLTGNFNIKYDESTVKYSFERVYYNQANERVNENNQPIFDANGGSLVNCVSEPADDSSVYLGFLGSVKNGNTFDLIEAKKEVDYTEGQTLSWVCPEGKSLVGFFYVVKNLYGKEVSISQPLKINPDEIDRASYLRGKGGVGNVIECKPGMNLNITIANFDEDGLLEQYPASSLARWSMRYAVWSVSN